MRSKKYLTEEMQAIRETWERIPAEALPDKDREKFQNRVRAVDMYIDGAKCKDIERESTLIQNMPLISVNTPKE